MEGRNRRKLMEKARYWCLFYAPIFNAHICIEDADGFGWQCDGHRNDDDPRRIAWTPWEEV